MVSQIRTGLTALGVALCAALTVTLVAHAQPKGKTSPISYTADGKLVFPADYRTWVYLSSGMDMAYTDAPSGANQHMFDNVFVNREAYESFQKTGTWPDKTIFMLEVRPAQGRGSINKSGNFQAPIVAGMEAHVKDTTRFKSGWAFFPFGSGKVEASSALPQDSACNTCHEQHGAVDTTFVQFYPTLMAKAREMNTLAAAYVAEEAARK